MCVWLRLLALTSLGSAAALTYRHEHASPRLSSAGARLWSLRGGATRLSLKFAAYDEKNTDRAIVIDCQLSSLALTSS